MSFFFFPQVHDIFYPFIQTTEDEFTFIWVNESKTGFSHLYKITSLLQVGCYRWTDDYQHVEGKRPGSVMKYDLIAIIILSMSSFYGFIAEFCQIAC